MDKVSYDRNKTSPELVGNSSVRYSPSREARPTAQTRPSAGTQLPHSSGSRAASSHRAAPAQPSANQPVSGANKRKTYKNKLAAPLKAARIGFVALLVLLIGVTVLFFLNQEPPKEDVAAFIDDGTFLNGITINGKSVGGLSYTEARDELINDVNETLRSVNVTIKHGTLMFVLNANDLGVTSSLNSVLLEAISLGRGGSVIANAEAKSQLEAEGKNYSIEYAVTDEKALAALENVGTYINTEPVEPSLEPDAWAAEPSFNIREGKDGYVLDKQAVLQNIKDDISAGVFDDAFEPDLVLVSPAATSESLLANAQLRSTFQTSFGGSRAARNEKRVGNIQKATTMLNGAKVENGEEFNFNAFIGPRTEAGGWPLAPGIVSGERYEDQAGGGICQVSTTLYNALLCSGPEIEITERRHHSWPSSYADKGLDSTVTGTVESGKSLNFINNTGSTLYIFAYCNTEDYTMTIYIYGVPLPDGVTYQVRGIVDQELQPGEPITIENPNWPVGYSEKTVSSRTGYKATAYRDKLVNGEVVETETLYTDTYNAVAEKTTVGTGDASLPQPATAG